MDFASILRGFFNDVCTLKSANPFSSALTTWASPASIRVGEIVVYFVDSQSSSLIRQNLPSAVPHSNTGSTAHGLPGGTISEVYVDAFKAMQNGVRGLAVVAFHEAMHNKLFPLNIHTSGGGGLALSPMSPDFGLTDGNKQLMAPALSTAVKQYII